MKKRKISLVLFLIGVFILSTGAIMGVPVAGSSTATGTADKKCSFAAVLGSKKTTGKVTITSVTVKDKFGHEKRITWKKIPGGGHYKPAVKITPPLENGDYVSIEVTTGSSSPPEYLDLNIY